MLYLKSIYAAASTAIAGVSAAYVQGGGHVGLVAGLTVAGSALGAAAVVWGVPNKPPAA